MADEFQEIEVNGEILEFPASMSDAEIKAVLDKQFAPTENNTIYGGIPALGNAVLNAPKTLRGLGEFLTQVGTSAVAQPVGGVEGVATGIEEPSNFRPMHGIPGMPIIPKFDFFNNDKAADALGSRVESMTFQPRGEVGQQISAKIGNAMERADLAVDDAALGVTGNNPAAATLAKTFALGVPEILGLKGAGRVLAPRAAPVDAPPQTRAPVPSGVPTVDDLLLQGGKKFDEARRAGSAISRQSAEQLRDRVTSLKDSSGLATLIDPQLHPQSSAVMKRVVEATEGELSFDNLIQARQLASDAAGTLDKADARIAMKIRDALDDHIDDLKAEDMIGGDPKLAAASLKEARDLWQRGRTAEFFEELVEKAKNEMGSNYSQAGLETAIRRKLKNELNSNRAKRFPPDIRAQMQEVVRGTKASNTLRNIGRVAPRGPITGGLLLGAGVVNPALGGLLYGVGEAGKFLSQRSTLNRFDKLVEGTKTGKLKE